MTEVKLDLKDHDLLILVNSKLDNLIDRFDKMDAEKRIRDLEVDKAKQAEEIASIQKTVDKLNTINGVWNFLNSLALAVAAWFAINK